jgi:hypothetical protein
MNLEVEHRELGGGWMEGFFHIDEVSAYLALQTGLPEATIRARIIQAFGHCKRPPKSGEKMIFMEGNLYSVDHLALRAMQAVIFDFVSGEEVGRIVAAYLDEENGDAHNIAFYYFDDEIHWMIVTAVLTTLRDRGRLPIHPSSIWARGELPES